ncbi:hypothetical protein, partial [Paenibacillus gorillae]|uniref:hypothetical protein n=1 Tax=Paenibacillus gorillae TaxID=1243662 RepID=UPI001EE19CBF
YRVFDNPAAKLVEKPDQKFDCSLLCFIAFSYEWRTIHKGSFARCSVFKEQFLLRVIRVCFSGDLDNISCMPN